jgi:hypothetical protein
MAQDAVSLPTMFDPSTCVRKGLCQVTKPRKDGKTLANQEAHSLYYEQHGSGPIRILCIIGYFTVPFFQISWSDIKCIYRLNTSSFAWLPQVDHFGHLPEYSILVFDNMGAGNSGAPRGPYSYVVFISQASLFLVN